MSKYVIILTIEIMGSLGTWWKDYANEDCFLSSSLLPKSAHQILRLETFSLLVTLGSLF